MFEDSRDRSISIKKTALCVVGLGAVGLAALKLPPLIDQLTDPAQKIPSDVQRLLNLTSRITVEGETINGAWIARSADDQNWIDSSCYVVDYLMRTNKQAFKSPRVALILDQQIQSVEPGLSARLGKFDKAEYRELGQLLTNLEELRLRRRCPEAETANLIINYCAPFRITDINELSTIRANASNQLDNVSYAGLPEL